MRQRLASSTLKPFSLAGARPSERLRRRGWKVAAVTGLPWRTLFGFGRAPRHGAHATQGDAGVLDVAVPA